MPDTTITIDRDQRDGLYELVRNHLGSIEDFWIALERTRDFAKAEQLGLEFAEDFRLLQDIGWGEEAERETFDLTMPAGDLMELLHRLQGEAAKVLVQSGSEAQAQREDAGTDSRFQLGYEACNKLLVDLDPRENDRGRTDRPLSAEEPVRLPARRHAMSGWRCRSGRDAPSQRLPFPEQFPPGLNHVVLTGTLLEKPHRTTSPRGDAVTMLRLGFPVRDPERPEDLWTLARCEVEVPAVLARRSASSLHVGSPVLAWGQLSDREATGDGSQWGVVVAAAIHSGAPAESFSRLFVVGER